MIQHQDPWRITWIKLRKVSCSLNFIVQHCAVGMWQAADSLKQRSCRLVTDERLLLFRIESIGKPSEFVSGREHQQDSDGGKPCSGCTLRLKVPERGSCKRGLRLHLF